jgi:molybdopterin-guanine dinucleotide biosynthesis protein B
VPALRLAGPSGAGKTVFGARLLAELRRRGHRVAALKHAARHPAPADVEGKDTSRYREVGADAVAGVFRDETVIRMPASGAALETLLEMLAPVADLVLVEGYNDADLPSLAISRRGSESRPAGRGRVLATVSDGAGAGVDGPCFAPEDVEGVADLIERWLPETVGHEGAAGDA